MSEKKGHLVHELTDLLDQQTYHVYSDGEIVASVRGNVELRREPDDDAERLGMHGEA